MSNQDYLLRMIEQFAIFIGRVIFHRDAGQYQDALRELDLIVRELAGLDPEDLAACDRNRLRDLLEAEEEGERLELLGRVLAERQRILAMREPEDPALELCREFALRFLLKAEGRGAPSEARHRDLLALAPLCPDAALAEIGGALAAHFEARGMYGKTEDLHFELVRIDREAHLPAALAFYDRLRALSDARLEAGKLPREELEEGRRALLRKGG